LQTGEIGIIQVSDSVLEPSNIAGTQLEDECDRGGQQTIHLSPSAG
jgi:hypothetical protein